MKDYYQQSIRALQLAGMSERTQGSYTRAVRLLVDFYQKTPDQITEVELEEYFLHCKNTTKWSPSTLGISYAGVRFFFINVLKRDWHIFSFLKAKKEHKLPCIMEQEEVFAILDKVRTFHNYTFLSTVYACGLRISEALALQVSDIDGKRMMIHVHRGKGAKDRYVPLPDETYQMLRQYWVTHRNPVFIFPALGRGHQEGATAAHPMAIASVQGAFRDAKYAAGIKKRRICVHTLRHCYATHLLERGVCPTIVQQYMGHASLETTMMYFHLTKKGREDACNIINSTMRGFRHDLNK